MNLDRRDFFKASVRVAVPEATVWFDAKDAKAMAVGQDLGVGPFDKPAGRT